MDVAAKADALAALMNADPRLRQVRITTSWRRHGSHHVLFIMTPEGLDPWKRQIPNQSLANHTPEEIASALIEHELGAPPLDDL